MHKWHMEPRPHFDRRLFEVCQVSQAPGGPARLNRQLLMLLEARGVPPEPLLALQAAHIAGLRAARAPDAPSRRACRGHEAEMLRLEAQVSALACH